MKRRATVRHATSPGPRQDSSPHQISSQDRNRPSDGHVQDPNFGELPLPRIQEVEQDDDERRKKHLGQSEVHPPCCEHGGSESEEEPFEQIHVGYLDGYRTCDYRSRNRADDHHFGEVHGQTEPRSQRYDYSDDDPKVPGKPQRESDCEAES